MDIAPYQRKPESGHGTDLESGAINQVASYSKKLPYNLSVGLKPAEIPLVFIRTNTTKGHSPFWLEMDPPLTFLLYVSVDAHFHISPFLMCILKRNVHGNRCILNKLPLIRIRVRTLAGGDLSLHKQLTASQLKETLLSNKCRHTKRGSHVTVFPLPLPYIRSLLLLSE